MRRKNVSIAKLFLILITFLTCCLILTAQTLEDFEKKITEYTLKNGLKFIIMENHEAPVVSFQTYADVGSVDEIVGITGIAHIFEHMAFKGTKVIGTKDIDKELKAMAAEDEAFRQLILEKRKGLKTDKEKLKKLEDAFQKAKNEARKYVKSNEFDEIVERAGCVGLNAGTSFDATRYLYSFPSNKVELWAYMESSRFKDPVLREFYTEKDVVAEERRMAVDNQPIGMLLEEFLALAYKAHPYGIHVIGHMADIQTITRQEALDFYKKYYHAKNMVIAIVGDVYPEELISILEEYYNDMPSKPKPEPVETVEPPQRGLRSTTIKHPSQPFIIMGYHKPDIHHPDQEVFEAITSIMGVGRTSRLYKKLVVEKKIALASAAITGLPGNKYPGLFIFIAVPTQGHTNEECKKAMDEEIEKLKTELVIDAELQRFKTRAKAGLIRSMSSNTGMAGELAFFEVVTGDWRNLFKQLEAIEKVTKEDIMRVAKEYFKETNCAIATIETEEKGK